MAFRPLHDRVLLRRVESDEKTKGGINSGVEGSIVVAKVAENPSDGFDAQNEVYGDLVEAAIVDPCQGRAHRHSGWRLGGGSPRNDGGLRDGAAAG